MRRKKTSTIAKMTNNVAFWKGGPSSQEKPTFAECANKEAFRQSRRRFFSSGIDQSGGIDHEGGKNQPQFAKRAIAAPFRRAGIRYYCGKFLRIGGKKPRFGGPTACIGW